MIEKEDPGCLYVMAEDLREALRPPGMGKREVLVALSEWREAIGWDGDHQEWGKERFWLLILSGGRL